MTAPLRILLGPQNPTRNVGEAIAGAALADGPLAVVSAGWQEAEGDLAELEAVIGRPLVELGLYRRADAVMQADPELAEAHRQRQDRLQERQRLYRLRLRSLVMAARRLNNIEGDGETLSSERRHAIKQLRALDRHHLKKCEAEYLAFEQETTLADRPSIAPHLEEIGELLEGTAGVVLTGGNVGVLINRLRLFGFQTLLKDKPAIGWSAGAMVMTPRIVLFHDRMPQGRRDAEVFGYGLGLVPGIVAMPDTVHRLRTDAKKRSALLAKRFSPDACVTLNNANALTWQDGRPIEVLGARRIDRKGRLSRLRVA